MCNTIFLFWYQSCKYSPYWICKMKSMSYFNTFVKLRITILQEICLVCVWCIIFLFWNWNWFLQNKTFVCIREKYLYSATQKLRFKESACFEWVFVILKIWFFSKFKHIFHVLRGRGSRYFYVFELKRTVGSRRNYLYKCKVVQVHQN